MMSKSEKEVNNVEVKVNRGGNHKGISKTTKPDVDSIKAKIKKGNARHELKKPCTVISRLDIPKEITYDNDIVRISPRGKMNFADADKLGELPRVIVKKLLTKKNIK